ncbi:hypothetical protein EK904_005947 [Melospiza melodia maxima]|nr:hypothetical protein EK904_005947 [Melospiza melodia maxima]
MEPEEEPGVAAVREVCEEVSAFTLPCQPGFSGLVFITLPSPRGGEADRVTGDIPIPRGRKAES